MKKMHLVVSLLAAGILAVIVCPGALADGGKPIAGVLDEYNPYNWFTFESSGNQVLFAEIKSEIYQTQGRKGGSHETDEGDEGGCSDDHSTGDTGSGSTGGGCTDSTHTDGTTHDDSCGGGGGAGDLCLQVLNPAGEKLCWAGRPSRPGWMRDPRLACPIPEMTDDQNFTLRVFRGQCGSPDMSGVTIEAGTSIAYLLEVRLLDIAQDGSLKDAMAQGGGPEKDN